MHRVLFVLEPHIQKKRHKAERHVYEGIFKEKVK